MSNDWLIKLEDVTISYRIERRIARKLKVNRIFTPLEHINMEVRNREFLSISGPNGSGKTSLLKVLSGLMQPFSGVVRRRVSNYGFVSQSQVLLPELSIKDNILLPYYLQKERDNEGSVSNLDNDRIKIEKKMVEQVKRFNIDGILEKKPQTCSVGQQQRALLVRALIMDRNIIFADEPEQNLDSDGRVELFETFKEAHQDFGKTIVLVTQEHPDVLKKYVSRGIKINVRDIESFI